MYFCDMGTLLTILFLLGLVPGRGALTPKDLRVAAAAEPAAVEAEDVRFSWIAEPKSDKVAGEGQTAWQLRVATHPLLLLKDKADLWDSGKVPGDASHLVPYGGVELPEGKTVYWTVPGRPSVNGRHSGSVPRGSMNGAGTPSCRRLNSGRPFPSGGGSGRPGRMSPAWGGSNWP